MDKKAIFHPVGPVGSIIIGVVLCGLEFAAVRPGNVSLGWIGVAFLLGGAIMLITRVMNAKKEELPK